LGKTRCSTCFKTRLGPPNSRNAAPAPIPTVRTGLAPDLGRDVEGGLRSQAQVVELFLDGQSGVDYCLPRRGNLL
jgi:hypothetical protein